MPRAVILTACPEEYLALRDHLTNIREETHPKGTVYELGQFSSINQIWEVAIAEIENNNASVASETERAINHFYPDIILLVSAAVGIKNVALGDIVIGQKIYGYESGRAEVEFYPHPEAHKPSYQLHERAKAERRKPDWQKRLRNEQIIPLLSILDEPVASGDKELSGEQTALVNFLHSQYGDAVAIEKLGYGFLNAADKNNKIPALTVHWIYQLLLGNPNIIDVDNKYTALLKISAFIFEIIAKHKISSVEMTSRYEGVIIKDINPDTLFTQIEQRFEVASSNSNCLIGERHRRIEYVKILFDRSEFSQAVEYLTSLREEIWHQSNNIIKYRLLANIGIAKWNLDQINDASSHFIEALQYNREDDAAIAFAAMGYISQESFNEAENLIEKALELNPANTLAYALRVRIIAATASIESALAQIPPQYCKSSDVLVAVGEAAFNRKLYDKAVESWQAALDSNCDGRMGVVKAHLAIALIDPIAKNYPLIAAGQLPPHQKLHLERAVSLLDKVIGGDYANPTDSSPHTYYALINRASALRLLSRNEEAIRDIDIARQKEPKNPDLLRQRALLAYEIGDKSGAYRYVNQMLSIPHPQELSLFASFLLMALKYDQEAEQILDQLLQTSAPEHMQLEAKHLKFELFLEREDFENAEALMNQLCEEDPDSVYTLIQRILCHSRVQQEENIPPLVEQAKTALASNFSMYTQIFLADTLYSLKYYRDASEIYEQFVDKTLNTPLSRRLAYTHYFSGDYKKALNLCQQLLDQYGPLEVISELAAHIYESIGDMEATEQICEDYLKIFPEDTVMQLRLAAANYAAGKYVKLDSFLDSRPDTTNLNFDNLKKLAQLYKVRNKAEEFFKAIYEVRHRFYDDVQAHVLYQVFYLEASKIWTDNQGYEIVNDGCGVLLRNDFGTEQWYILQNQADAVFAQNELNSSQPLYHKLMGKHVGDKIVETEGSFGCPALFVEAITDKYFAASKQSISILENQPTNNFRVMAVPLEDDSQFSAWVQDFIEDLKKQQDHFEYVKKQYLTGIIPFGMAAIAVQRTPLELWQILAFGADASIRSWSPTEGEKFSDAIQILQKGGLVIIDPISLVTLHSLEVADDVVGILGKFGIAQSTIDLFQVAVEKVQGIQSEGFSTFGVFEDQAVYQDLSPEQVLKQKNFFERILNWSRCNCVVLSCNRRLDFNKTTLDKIVEFMGSAFVDTALIAGENGRILYSDDQWFRSYCLADSGVPGVWTQVVLKYCLTQHRSNPPLYHKAVLELARMGYACISINEESLIMAARLCEWKILPTYSSALRMFAKNTKPDYLAPVAANFLHQLYLEFLPEDVGFLDPRDALVFELLRVLTEKPLVENFTLKLKRAICERFRVNPINMEKVLEVIIAWDSSHLDLRYVF
jgi:tetratricopeptide (TPR) repeat protein